MLDLGHTPLSQAAREIKPNSTVRYFNTEHEIGNVLLDIDPATQEVTRFSFYSLTSGSWINLLSSN